MWSLIVSLCSATFKSFSRRSTTYIELRGQRTTELNGAAKNMVSTGPIESPIETLSLRGHKIKGFRADAQSSCTDDVWSVTSLGD